MGWSRIYLGFGRVSMSKSADETQKLILELVAKQLNLKAETIKPDLSFAKDLKADSLDIVELVMSIEEKFNIHILDEDAAKLQTVKALANYIERKKKN